MAVKADITIDIDKQVGNLQNLTNIYNARVGDNNTPLTVLWQKNGIALNLKGLHAFIAGKVGDGSYNSETDKVDFPVGTPVVKYEDDGSGTLDNGQSGLTTLLIPKQMWQKSGIFAGYIGLKDENGSVFTSKDIFFKVLGNVLDAGVAINYFIDDFSKVIQNSKLKLQENIDDARNAYENETKNTHDALLATQAEVDATRENNKALNQQIENQQQYINANNIVTRPDLAKVQASIDDRLGNMQLKIQTYDTLDALKQTYPYGADGLFYVLDSGDQYQWDDNTKSWVDKGKLVATGLSKKDSQSLSLAANHLDVYNNLPNPTFTNGLVGWNYVGNPTSFELDTKNTVDNNPSLHLNVSGKDTATWYYILSDPFKVTAGNNIRDCQIFCVNSSFSQIDFLIIYSK